MKAKHIITIVATGVALTGLTGCNLYKKFEMPTDTPITKEYVEADSMQRNPQAYGNLQWEQVFTDPALQELIRQALENNADYANAKLNVDIAQARLQGAKLAYLPSVALAPTGGKSWTGGNRLPWGGSDWTYSIPLSVSWEVDIFARMLNTKRGAKAALLQSEDYRQAARSQIISAVAATYYTISALESQLELSRNTATLWGESVEVMKNLKLAGRVNESAVVQSTAQYYSILGNITDIEVQLREMYNTLSLLVNAMPGNSWNVPAQHSTFMPQIVRESVPMVELASRPDVKAAEHGLASAYYNTNVARSGFYPQFSISATGGFTNSLGSMVLNPGEWFLNLAGNLVAPLFSRGQNIANLKMAKAQQQQALNSFEYAVMNAAAEVSNAMVTYTKATEKQEYLTNQTENYAKSVEYTQELLQFGTSTYLEVLTAQQALLSSQIGEISCRLTRERALINLYQSLGGGR